MSAISLFTAVPPKVLQDKPLPATPIQANSKTSKSALDSLKNYLTARNVYYTDRVFSVTRYSINSLVNLGKWVAAGYKKADKQLRTASSTFKMLSIITLPSSLAALPAVTKRLFQDLHTKNREIIAVSTLSFTYAIGDILDSIATVGVAIADLASKACPFLATVGLPLALAAVANKIVNTTIHIFQLYKVKKDFNENLFHKIEKLDPSTPEYRTILKIFLEKHVDLSSSDNVKNRQLEKRTNTLIASKLRELAEMINNNESLSTDQIHTINKTLKFIKVSMHDEMVFESCALATQVVTAVGFSMFLTPVAPAAPFIILAINAAAQILLNKYKDHKLEQNASILTR